MCAHIVNLPHELVGLFKEGVRQQVNLLPESEGLFKEVLSEGQSCAKTVGLFKIRQTHIRSV